MGRLGTFSPTSATVYPITGPQLNFLTSLTNELFDLTSRMMGTDQTDARTAALAVLPSLSKSAASKRISDLKESTLPTLRATVRQSYAAQVVEAPASAPAPVELDTDGIYVVGNDYFRVFVSAAGRQYAKKLDTASRSWEYAPGAIRSITPAHRITAEHAARLPFSWCIRCGKELSRKDSIDRRMGPVCYAKSVG